MTRRIGILGGTFDPIHIGHLDMALAAERALQLTRMIVIPASLPPHRIAPVASTFHRFAMAALAVSQRPRWQASDIELRRSDVSFTSVTLRHFHDRGCPASDIYFVIGADAFADIESWHDYPAILDFAHFVVVSRHGSSVMELPARLPNLASRMVVPTVDRQTVTGQLIFLIDAATADVSSSAIRQYRAEGRSIEGLVDRSVQQHIEQHGLYASSDPDRRHDERAARAGGRQVA